MEIDMEEFAAHLKARRAERPLKEVADEIGDISASTLSRIENGKLPDLNTYMKICRWLGESSDRFAVGDKKKKEPTSAEDIVYAHLRADKKLDPKTANALITMIEAAYKAVDTGQLKKKR